MSTPSARTGGSLDAWFKISQRGSTVRQEVVAGLTTFLAMVYSVIVVPGMLGKAGFPPAAVFVATCLVAGLGSIVMGLWANLPLAIGCAISLTAFTAFSLVLGQHISVPVALGAVFLMGVLFTVISATGIRSWILRNCSTICCVSVASNRTGFIWFKSITLYFYEKLFYCISWS